MKDTSLGLGGRELAATMQCQVEEHNDWDWNSAYWRNLGSPWGGAHSTAADVGRFLRYFAEPSPPVLKPATVAAMITDQNRGLNTPWGIGWMLGAAWANTRRREHSGTADPPGRWRWMDPEKGVSFVLLTTKPAALSNRALLSPVSDVISEVA